MPVTGAFEREELLGHFRAIALDRLRKIIAYVIALEQNHARATELVELTRELHTLKGEARLLELEEIANLVHRLEDVLGRVRALLFRDEVREGAREEAREGFDLLLRGADLCQVLIAAPPDIGAASSELAQLEQRVKRFTEPAPDSKPPHAANPTPVPPAPLAPAAAPVAPVAHDSLVPEERDSFEHVQVLARDVERLAGVVATLRSTSEVLAREISALKAHERISPMLRATARRSIELTESVLDGARELDQEMRRLRMAPLSELSPQVRRTVRDVCRATNKSVKLEIAGAELAVDRTVLAAMREALGHLVRNAVVHGIEAPQERIQRGKPAEGLIAIRAFERGGMAHVMIADDGAGIDPLRVREAAIRAGVITRARADALSPRDVLRLVFRSGVSTSDAADEVAGRGVGLDVVERRIEEVRGTVEAQSVRGLGTTFRIEVPVSLATARLTVVRSGGMRFAIPAWAVESIEPVSPGQRWLNVGENELPLVRAPIGSEHLRAPLERLRDRTGIALVLNTAHGEHGLIVDEVLGAAEPAITAPPPALIAKHKLLDAVADIGAGELVPVLDAAGLVELAIDARTETADLAAPQPRKILVADDSPVTLAVVLEIIEGLGFRAAGAHDGVEALEEIAKERPDLLLTDLEMPNLGGFELIERIRADAALRDLPIVVLTSRSADEDRKRASEAGASAYLLKADFRQEKLASLIAALIPGGAEGAR